MEAHDFSWAGAARSFLLVARFIFIQLWYGAAYMISLLLYIALSPVRAAIAIAAVITLPLRLLLATLPGRLHDTLLFLMSEIEPIVVFIGFAFFAGSVMGLTANLILNLISNALGWDEKIAREQRTRAAAALKTPSVSDGANTDQDQEQPQPSTPLPPPRYGGESSKGKGPEQIQRLQQGGSLLGETIHEEEDSF